MSTSGRAAGAVDVAAAAAIALVPLWPGALPTALQGAEPALAVSGSKRALFLDERDPGEQLRGERIGLDHAAEGST